MSELVQDHFLRWRDCDGTWVFDTIPRLLSPSPSFSFSCPSLSICTFSFSKTFLLFASPSLSLFALCLSVTRKRRVTDFTFESTKLGRWFSSQQERGTRSRWKVFKEVNPVKPRQEALNRAAKFIPFDSGFERLKYSLQLRAGYYWIRLDSDFKFQRLRGARFKKCIDYQ